jgi:acyl carrier protein
VEPARVLIKVKEITAHITGIPLESICESAMFVEDLSLNSLAIMGTVVEKASKTRPNDEELQAVRSIGDIVCTHS